MGKWTGGEGVVRELVAQFAQEPGKGMLSLDAAALATLETFPWPGNIRQLRNVVHQAVLASPGPLVRNEPTENTRAYGLSESSGERPP